MCWTLATSFIHIILMTAHHSSRVFSKSSHQRIPHLLQQHSHELHHFSRVQLLQQCSQLPRLNDDEEFKNDVCHLMIWVNSNFSCEQQQEEAIETCGSLLLCVFFVVSLCPSSSNLYISLVIFNILHFVRRFIAGEHGQVFQCYSAGPRRLCKRLSWDSHGHWLRCGHQNCHQWQHHF